MGKKNKNRTTSKGSSPPTSTSSPPPTTLSPLETASAFVSQITGANTPPTQEPILPSALTSDLTSPFRLRDQSSQFQPVPLVPTTTTATSAQAATATESPSSDDRLALPSQRDGRDGRSRSPRGRSIMAQEQTTSTAALEPTSLTLPSSPPGNLPSPTVPYTSPPRPSGQDQVSSASSEGPTDILTSGPWQPGDEVPISATGPPAHSGLDVSPAPAPREERPPYNRREDFQNYVPASVDTSSLDLGLEDVPVPALLFSGGGSRPTTATVSEPTSAVAGGNLETSPIDAPPHGRIRPTLTRAPPSTPADTTAPSPPAPASADAFLSALTNVTPPNLPAPRGGIVIQPLNLGARPPPQLPLQSQNEESGQTIEVPGGEGGEGEEVITPGLATPDIPVTFGVPLNRERGNLRVANPDDDSDSDIAPEDIYDASPPRRRTNRPIEPPSTERPGTPEMATNETPSSFGVPVRHRSTSTNWGGSPKPGETQKVKQKLAEKTDPETFVRSDGRVASFFSDSSQNPDPFSDGGLTVRDLTPSEKDLLDKEVKHARDIKSVMERIEDKREKKMEKMRISRERKEERERMIQEMVGTKEEGMFEAIFEGKREGEGLSGSGYGRYREALREKAGMTEGILPEGPLRVGAPFVPQRSDVNLGTGYITRDDLEDVNLDDPDYDREVLITACYTEQKSRELDDLYGDNTSGGTRYRGVKEDMTPGIGLGEIRFQGGMYLPSPTRRGRGQRSGSSTRGDPGQRTRRPGQSLRPFQLLGARGGGPDPRKIELRALEQDAEDILAFQRYVNGKEDETCVKLGLAALKQAMKQGLGLAKEKLDLRNQLNAQRKLITDLTTHLDSFTAEKQAQLDLAQAFLAEKIGELAERDEKIDEAFQLVSDNVTLRIQVRDQGMLLKETLGYVEKYEKRGTEAREQIADMAKRLAEKDRQLARLKEVEKELERVRKELEVKNKLINDFLLDGSGEPTKMGDLYISRAVQQLAEQKMALEKKDKETEELTTKKDQEIKELTDQLRFLSHENATRTVRNEDDEITINDLRRQIEEYQQGGEGIITVEQCDAKLDEERAEFEAIMADYEDDNKNLEAQLELVEGIYKDEITNTKMLYDKVRELEGNVEELEETVQELVEQLDAQPVPVAPERQTGWLSSLFGVKEPPQELLTLPQCYEKNKKRIESRDKRIQELEQQVEAANRMLQTSHQLVQLPVQDDRPLHEQIADLGGLVAHYKQGVDRQREELAARGLGIDFGPTEQYNFERIRELEQELKDTKDELEGLQGEELAKMRRLGHLEQEVKRLERELTSSQADKRKLNDGIRKLNGIIDKHKRDVREPRKLISGIISDDGIPRISLAVDFAILRCEIALRDMVNKRALRGFIRGDGATAIRAAQDAVAFCDNVNDGALIGRSYFWLGVAYYYNDDIDQAIECLQCAERHKEEWSEPRSETKWLDAWIAAAKRTTTPKAARYYGGVDGLTRQTSNESSNILSRMLSNESSNSSTRRNRERTKRDKRKGRRQS